MPDNEIKLKLVIDGKEALASISLTDNELKKLATSIRNAGDESRNSGEKIVHAFAQARNLIQGLKETFSLISQALQSNITAYQEQEAALVKLTTALNQTNQLTDANVKSLTDYAAQLQRTTIYGDEVTETVMAQLLAMGLSVEQTKQATLQAANLATVMGTDLNSAARAMADLFNGNVGMIGRYVKGLDETIIKSGDLDKIMAMLNERIGGQAEAIGKSSVGALARMNNAIGDLKENTGQLLSNALQPFVSVISDLVKRLNDVSPELSGLIGLVGSLTTVFVTLRVTGIMPAIQSIELFGIALTGLRAAFIKTGIGALVVALGYGFYELAKAYEHWKDVSSGADKSFEDVLTQVKNESLKLSKSELDWSLKDAEKQKEKLSGDIKKLKNDIQKAKEEVVTKDKDGNEYRNYYETEESKRLSEQLKQTEQLIKLEESKIKIYKDVQNVKQGGEKLTDEELKALFEKNKVELSEAQRHQAAMLKITSDNDFLMLSQKIEHFDQMIELYKKYGQDITGLVNQRAEAEAELNKKTEKSIIPRGLEKNLRTKLKLIELNADETTKINEEHAKEQARIEELTTEDKLNLLDEQKVAVADAMGQIAGVFAQHTLAYQAFAKAQALIDTYTSAEAAYKSLVGIPIVGPALAVAAAAAAVVAGLARVEQIGKVDIPKGYALGGRLPKGEAGFIEGYHNEIIAPEKTFVEVFKQELRPQIYGNNATLNYDLSGIKDSLNKLNNALEQGIIARAYLDDYQAKKITARGSYLLNKSKL
ncbi:MAG: hypothetical protein ACOYWZ_07375 [Bacillota bacterium]